MAYSALTSGETDADSPVDQTLWTKVKDNFDFLKTKSEGQTVNTQDGAYTSFVPSTQMPIDDTIPQNTEGDEVMTLSITPNSATSKLKIEVIVNGFHSNSQNWSIALFQDSTASALCANTIRDDNQTQIVMTYYMTSGTASATTFKVRAGNEGVSTDFNYNGNAANRLFGGVYYSSITITEIP